MQKKSYFHMAAILKLKMAISKHIFDGRIRILTTENIKLCENVNFLSSLEATFGAAAILKFKMATLSYKIMDCYHMKMIYGDTKPHQKT